MTKENIIRKLTSRKLWVSVCSFVTLICTANGMAESEAGQVAAIIMAGATVIGYVIGEGLVDKENQSIEVHAEAIDWAKTLGGDDLK